MAKKQYKHRETTEIVRPPQESVSQYLTHPITILIGSAGVGKTDLSTRIGLEHMRHGGEKVVVSRPQVECDGERIGFLPGDVSQKLVPWLLPFMDVMTRILGDESAAEAMLDSFEHVPLALVRGRTWRNCTAILDEAQNCTKAQLLAFCTRLGVGGRIVITGDANQSDLHPSKQCFLRVADELVLAGVASIHVLTKNYRGEWIEKIENAFARIK